jgi:hypothetical protein
MATKKKSSDKLEHLDTRAENFDLEAMMQKSQK